MSDFTASNGITIRYTVGIDGAARLIGTSPRPTEDAWTEATASPEGIEALREFFRAEEDKRLGRWRWPENPDYVVYPDGTSRLVLRESTGRQMMISLHDRKVMETYLDSYVGAARAFDDAHPEPKPWWGADVDEAWELTVNGDTGPFVTKLTPAGTIRFVAGNGTEFISEASDITAGRRIYPEVAS